MKREDTIKVLSVLKAAYPNFYKNMSKEEAMGAINLWTMQLSNIPCDIVLMAVNKIIATSKWPPSIAEVREKIKDLYYEAVGSLVSIDCDDKQKELLLRISRYCRYASEEPQLLNMIQKNDGGGEIEAYDPQKRSMSSLPSRG